VIVKIDDKEIAAPARVASRRRDRIKMLIRMALRHAEVAFDLARNCQGRTLPVIFLPSTLHQVPFVATRS
jgi:hypothetical protein